MTGGFHKKYFQAAARARSAGWQTLAGPISGRRGNGTASAGTAAAGGDGGRDGERLRSTANRRQAEGRRACSDGRGAKEEGEAKSTSSIPATSDTAAAGWLRRYKAVAIIIGALVVLWAAMWAVVPRPLFRDPCSTLLYSREGELLGARIAADGQWRFPPADTLPRKYIDCLTTYEDKRFFWHPGVDPIALARAAATNLRRGRVVSGGSTITMQMVRQARGNRPRTAWEKAVEIIWALWIETTHSKRTILNLYASNAPYGGNVVGVETAAWRYFGRSAADLSWAEAATLAVLPNSPALIHPGRNRATLLEKRNALLSALVRRRIIDEATGDLAAMEPLPGAPLPLPDQAPHLADRIVSSTPGIRAATSLDGALQRRVTRIAEQYSRDYSSNYIYNLAAIVADVETGEILAYIGNSSGAATGGDGGRDGERAGKADAENGTASACGSDSRPVGERDGERLRSTARSTFPQPARPTDRSPQPAGAAGADHGNNVDVIASPRSTGSVLKPILYAAMLTDGQILPGTLIPDTPLNINGFAPQNFNHNYSGAVPANVAIERSLNVPLVRMLSMYNTGRFLTLLRKMGMTTLPYDEDHYGASLILGGAEGTLLDIAGIYASMARTLNHYDKYNGQYDLLDIHPLTPFRDTRGRGPLSEKGTLDGEGLLSHASIWFAFEAMSGLNRPEEEADWQQFSSMQRVAWKTGTSFGGRDAWAVGVTPRYVVGVWAGNASGEGRPGLTGVGYAAPVMFDIFSGLPSRGWFPKPYEELEPVAVCRHSGYKAGELCDPVDTVEVPRSGAATAVCPFHVLVHLTADGRWRVNSSCESVENIVSKGWFVLPPAQEYYYRTSHADYHPLPPLKPGCRTQREQIDIIYPEQGSVLVLPAGFNGQQRFVFRAAHSRPGATIYWHLDDKYIGETVIDHQISCAAGPGHHILTLVDDEGNSRKIAFDVK